MFFFFNDTATTEIYTLSLHDALPISTQVEIGRELHGLAARADDAQRDHADDVAVDQPELVVLVVQGGRVEVDRSEEHTSELQSRQYLVCRLLLEKKNNTITTPNSSYS